MKRFLSFLCLVSLTTLVAAQPNADAPRYTNGWNATVRFGIELYKALKPNYRPLVHVKPINVEMDVTPFARLEVLKTDEIPNPMATVFISVGFIDLVNNVAHAKAIDKVQRGYFEKYILSLSQETGEMELKELPNIKDPRYWSREVMNEQVSNFNQIVGVVVGTKLSHYYLGHYQKYSAKMFDPSGKPVPINTLLTPAEWDQALRCGTINALNCGLGIDGVIALYECIEKMPKRPEWTLYFMPEKVKVSRMKSAMKKLESDFFSGKEL